VFFDAAAGAQGGLAWGADDFDESYPLPCTTDLVRPPA
jgi:uncharacterized protein (DUF2252 family)